MLDKLINLLERICEALAVGLLGYFYGKEKAENEQCKADNGKLKKGLDAAVRGDYSPDAVRDRMRENKPKD